jgi:PAS domain S-box-containing protein
LLVLFIVCTAFYYFGELIVLFGWGALRWDIFYTVHDPHRMLFLVPILYASYYYRLRGAVLANVISLLIFLPRAFFVSLYPDPILRMFIFVIVATVMSLLAVVIFNQRDKRRELTDALKQSKEKYLNILQYMFDSYYEVDLSGKFTFVNDSVCRSLGYSREELIGKNYRLTTPADDIKRVLAAFNEVYRTGEPNKGIEHKILCKNGSTIPVESSISLRKNEKGDIIGFRSISRDISERKQAEEALHNSEEKYRSLVENINDVLIALDTQGKITYVSPEVESMSKYTVSDLIGKAFTQLIYPDDLPALLDRFTSLLSGKLEPWEFRIVDKDGTLIFVRTSSRPAYEDGEVVGITTLMTNITEHKKVEEALLKNRGLLSEM